MREEQASGAEAKDEASTGGGSNLGSTWFELFFSFIRVQTWVQLGFELLEEFELFQGSENSILNLGLT